MHKLRDRNRKRRKKGGKSSFGEKQGEKTEKREGKWKCGERKMKK